MSYAYAYDADTPISGPVTITDWKVGADFNGILWSNTGGFFFGAAEANDPITGPA